MTLFKTPVKTLAVVCVFVVPVNHQPHVLMTTSVPIKLKLFAVTLFLLLFPLFALHQTSVLLCHVIHVVRLEVSVSPKLLIAVVLLELITVPPSPVTWPVVYVIFQTLLLVLHVIVPWDHGLNGPLAPLPVVPLLKPDLDLLIKLL